MSGFKIAEAFVSVKSDATGLRDEVSRDVKEAGAGQEIKVGLKVDKGALGGLMANLAPFIMPSIAAVTQLSGVLGLVPAAAGAAGLAYGTLKVGMTSFADSLKTGDTPAQLKKANEALADLSPNARAAALTVRGLGPAWDSVRMDVQNRLFAGMSDVIKTVAKTDLPVLRTGMDSMSTVFNGMVRNFATWITSSRTLGDVKTMMADSSTATWDMGRALTPVLDMLKNIGVVGASFLPGLASGFATSATKAADFIQNARDTGKIHEWIQTGIDAFSSLWQVVKNIVGIFLQIANAPGFSPNMISALAAVTGWILKLIQNVPELIPIIESALVLWRLWAIAQWAVNAAMDANPIGLIVLAIGALIAATVLIVTHWQQVKAVLDEVWGWIKATAMSVFNAVKDFLVGVWDSITGYFVARWNQLRDTATTIFNAIRDFFSAIWNFIRDVTTTVWNAITDYLTRLWNAHKDLIIPIYTAIRDFLTGIWNSIRDTATSIWNAISAFFTTVWNAIRNTVETVWNAIVAFLTPALNAFRSLFETVWNAVSSVFTGVWNAISSTATNVWNSINGFLTGAFNTFKGFFSGVWNGIVGDFQSIWGRITGIAQGIWNDVINAFKAGINAVIGLANRFVIDDIDAILKFFLIPTIPSIPMLASGGTVGGGFQTNGPMAIVGEGNQNHPEYVIPTDPAHRGNALALYQSLGAKLMASGGVLGAVDSWISGGAGALNGIIDQLVSGMQAGVYRSIAAGLGHKMVGGVQALVDKAMQSFSAAFTGSPNLAGWIQQALGLTGTPESWAGPLSVLIGRESGGNPNAINRTDSNAAAGHPSQGLMQTIPSTFNAYHQPGTSWNITDPVANIAAGINYIKARYGSIFNVQQANPNLPPKGYDAGGLLPTGLSLVRNSTGQPERVLNATQTARLDQLLGGPGGGGQVTNHFHVTLDAKSVAEMQGVVQFFDRVQQVARATTASAGRVA
ncbi:MAG TPA: transglycosylase SLT domain-containing protein [Pseudonocardiaceae bacterium]|jgi:SLT domain-containing protein